MLWYDIYVFIFIFEGTSLIYVEIITIFTGKRIILFKEYKI